jgi:hypothetical protein
VDLLDDESMATVSAVTSSLENGRFIACSAKVDQILPEARAEIEIACGCAKADSWWRYHVNTDTALTFSGCTLEVIQNFQVKSKGYRHGVSVGGRVLMDEQRKFGCEYAGRMEVDEFTAASAKFSVDTNLLSPSFETSVSYLFSPTIKLGALVGGSPSGFSSLGLSLDFDLV